MPTIHADLISLAKNLESSQKKAEKAKEKGSNKLAGAMSSSEETALQWNSRAPFAFEQLQSVDEARLNNLRNILTQFQTHEVDNIERCRKAAETCLNAILNIESSDEIKAFVAKFQGSKPRAAPEAAQLSSREQQHHPIRPTSSYQDDTVSQVSGRSSPLRTPSHGRFRELSRILMEQV